MYSSTSEKAVIVENSFPCLINSLQIYDLGIGIRIVLHYANYISSTIYIELLVEVCKGLCCRLQAFVLR